MTKKAPYPYSPGTRMGETLRDSSPKERDLVLIKRGVMQDAIRFNEDFNEVTKHKRVIEKVKAEIEKTFNGITDFSHIKALYDLMGKYPNWDVTKIKLKPSNIEFEVDKGETIKLSIADLPGKFNGLTAFEEVRKFNLDILRINEWQKIITLMPGYSTEERVKNLKKLCNLKDGKYLSSSGFYGDGESKTFLFINFENFDVNLYSKEEIINVRGALV